MPASIQSFCLVFVGAGFGGTLRHGVNTLVAKIMPMQTVVIAGFPLSTFLINISGSFVMGLIIGYLAFYAGAVSVSIWPQALRLFITTGILGGYTTFSAFSLEAILLLERGAYLMAAFYVVGSVAFSLLACALALALMR